MIKWPSFDNLHRLFTSREARLRRVVFEEYAPEGVLVTEKLDGSNLSFRVNEFGITQICGRNTALWKAVDPQDKEEVQSATWRKTQKYCGVQLSDFATDAFLQSMVDLRQRLVTKPTVDIQVYGEALQQKVGKGVHGAWFPFGVIYIDSDPVVQATAEEEPHDEETSIERMFHAPVLVQTQTMALRDAFSLVGLTPPRMLCDGPVALHDAISILQDLMVNPPYPHFEGAFITFNSARPIVQERVLGFKYKSAAFDEQPGWVVEEGEVPECMLAVIPQMKVVFDLKQSIQLGKKEKEKEKEKQKVVSPEAMQFQHQITLAVASVMSKRQESYEDVKNMDKVAFNEFWKEILPQVTADALSQYSNAGLPPPSDSLMKSAQGIVIKILKAGGPAGEGGA